MNLIFECRRVLLEWKGFGLESFRNDTSLSLYIYTHIRTCVTPKGLDTESFPLKYKLTTSECKINSVDLQYFKYLYTKNYIFWLLFSHPSNKRKMDGRNSEFVILTV